MPPSHCWRSCGQRRGKRTLDSLERPLDGLQRTVDSSGRIDGREPHEIADVEFLAADLRVDTCGTEPTFGFHR